MVRIGLEPPLVVRWNEARRPGVADGERLSDQITERKATDSDPPHDCSTAVPAFARLGARQPPAHPKETYSA